MYVIRIGRLLDEKNLIDQIPSNFHRLVELKGYNQLWKSCLNVYMGSRDNGLARRKELRDQ